MISPNSDDGVGFFLSDSFGRGDEYIVNFVFSPCLEFCLGEDRCFPLSKALAGSDEVAPLGSRDSSKMVDEEMIFVDSEHCESFRKGEFLDLRNRLLRLSSLASTVLVAVTDCED
eukprot:CAMPEP_0204614614 /NCGR_PEP_ID=MMETSP0717-20131115/2296_1 /ASSEMBLY_ACC=CAM_ASM_000666 /TAXON_ID=230516 /ORGANISM="Chaetoceros curvisetus" /LENGTH=114 /DNA_ID=CAMNT_0051627321 /DNA_START=275 /DNA_END=619 /DNA_ORIENTATION=+